MIVIISKDAFLDNVNKLLKKNLYGIINGTSSEKMDRIGAVRHTEEDFQYLQAAASLTKETEMGLGVKTKKMKAYLERLPRMAAFAAALQLSNEEGNVVPEEKLKKNVFIVLTNNTYKALSGQIRRQLLKYYDFEKEEDEKFIVEYHKFPKGFEMSDEGMKLCDDALRKIDKKINNLNDELDSDFDGWDDTDVEAVHKKIKKLRKERESISASMHKSNSDSVKDLPDAIKVDLLNKNAAISKSARKALDKFRLKYANNQKNEGYLSREY